MVVDASVQFGQDNKFLQFWGQIATIITNKKIVDKLFVINPVLIGMGKKDWKDVKDIPSNMTALGGYIKISSKSLHTVEKKPAFGSNEQKSGGYTYLLDMVHFTFAMLCDVEPSELISRILSEWMKAGGVGLYIKDIATLNTVLPFVIFYLFNTVIMLIIKDKLKWMLEIGINLLAKNVMEDDGVPVVVLPTYPGLIPQNTLISPRSKRRLIGRGIWRLSHNMCRHLPS